MIDLRHTWIRSLYGEVNGHQILKNWQRQRRTNEDFACGPAFGGERMPAYRVALMVREGLVTITPIDDSYEYIAVTEDGKAVFKEAIEAEEAVNRALYADWDD
jgi:hypothetical protein